MATDLKDKLKKKKIRNRIIIILAVLLIVGLIVKSAVDAKKGKMLVYETVDIDRGEITAVVSSTGNLSPVTTVEVGSQVSGIIQEIFVDYNDRVKKGDILAKIDPELYETQLEQAEARLKSRQSDLEVAKVDYEKAKISIAQAEAEVHQARAGIAQAEADLENARGNHINSEALLKKAKAQLENDRAENERARQLFEKELISHSDRDKADTVWQVSKASVDSAEAGVRSALANVRASQSRLTSSKANYTAALTRKQSAVASADAALSKLSAADSAIAQANGDIDQIRVNLRRCIITSTVDGVVIDKKVEPGQTVAASFQAPVLFQLAENLKNMEVQASVDEADIGRVKEGQNVTFTVDAFPDDKFEGTISQVRSSPVKDQNVVTYQVIILTDNDDLKLKPGMTANIDITIEVKEEILRIQNSALRFRAEKIENFPMPDNGKDKKDKGDKDKDKDKGKDKDKEGDKDKKEGKPEDTGKKDEKGKGPEKKDKDWSTVWALIDEKPVAYLVETGISDNMHSEILESKLKPLGKENKKESDGETHKDIKIEGEKKREGKTDVKSKEPPLKLEKGMKVISDAVTAGEKKQQADKMRRRRGIRF